MNGTGNMEDISAETVPLIKLKSKDGRVTTEVPEKYVKALLDSGKYVLDEKDAANGIGERNKTHAR